jgi:hypothetical protein
MKNAILTILAIMSLNLTANAAGDAEIASSGLTQRLLFSVSFFQGNISPDLAQYRLFLRELEKNGIEIQSENLYPVREVTVFQKLAGQEIDELLMVKGLHGCSQFDAACIRLINRLNPGADWKNKNFADDIDLPLLTLRHDLVVIVLDKAQKLNEIMKKFKQNITTAVGNPI